MIEYHKGMRIQAHPATLLWMMGDRYGVIVGRTVKCLGGTDVRGVRVRMDRSGKIRVFHPYNLLVEWIVTVDMNSLIPAIYTMFAADEEEAKQFVLDRHPEWGTRPMKVRRK